MGKTLLSDKAIFLSASGKNSVYTHYSGGGNLSIYSFFRGENSVYTHFSGEKNEYVTPAFELTTYKFGYKDNHILSH
jgi:hypothetical protein